MNVLYFTALKSASYPMKRPLKHTRKDVEETKNKKEDRRTRTDFWKKLNTRTSHCKTARRASY